jgi:hypothetical protein
MNANEIMLIGGRPMFYAPNGQPISLVLYEELSAIDFMRRVALDSFITYDGHAVDVSTVFLFHDHGFRGGPPVIWETMVFGYPGEGQYRYTSPIDAIKGHIEICKALRDGPPDHV